MEQRVGKATLEALDWRLLNFLPEFSNMVELEKMLETRGPFVTAAAHLAQAEPTEANRARLERSMHAGDELTRKLAAYRRMLESELARVNNVARHGRALGEDVPNDVPGDTG